MKIAVCLYGLAGGEIDTDKGIQPVLLSDSFNNYQEVLFKGLDVDFFLHSWSEEHKDELLQLYQPKKYLIEPQIDFSKYSLSDYSLEHINTYKKIFAEEEDVKEYLSSTYIFNSHSRWCSTFKTVGLMKEYADQNNIFYDWVFQVRMDLFFREAFPFEILNPMKIYTCPRFTIDADITLNDAWFLSNMDNALKISTLYENILDYSIWTHAASRQHIDAFEGPLEFFPSQELGIKNYWMMRSVVQEEMKHELSLVSRFRESFKERLRAIRSKLT